MEFCDNIGYEKVIADWGKDAEQTFESHTFNLVIFDLPIFDLVMRDFRCIEMLRTLMANNKKVPFLLITGYSTIQTAVEAIKNGAYDYIIKPFSMDELRIKVERALMTNELKTSLERAYLIALILILSIPILFITSIILGLILAM